MVHLRRRRSKIERQVVKEIKVRRRMHKFRGTEPIVLTRKQFRGLRPARNVIVQALWVCLFMVSVNQLTQGVSPDSVNTSLNFVVQVVLSWFIVAVSALMLLGAWYPRDGVAMGMELVGAFLGVGGFAVYTLIIMDTNEKWWSTAGFAWALALFGGSITRGIQILRRGY